MLTIDIKQGTGGGVSGKLELDLRFLIRHVQKLLKSIFNLRTREKKEIVSLLPFPLKITTHPHIFQLRRFPLPYLTLPKNFPIILVE